MGKFKTEAELEDEIRRLEERADEGEDPEGDARNAKGRRQPEKTAEHQEEDEPNQPEGKQPETPESPDNGEGGSDTPNQPEGEDPSAEDGKPPKGYVDLRALQATRRELAQVKAERDAMRRAQTAPRLPADAKQLESLMTNQTGETTAALVQMNHETRQELRDAIEEISVNSAKARYADFDDAMALLVQEQAKDSQLLNTLAHIRATSRNPAEELYQISLTLRDPQVTTDREAALAEKERQLAEKERQLTELEAYQKGLKDEKGRSRTPSPGSAPRAAAGPPSPREAVPSRRERLAMGLSGLERLASE